MHVNNVKSLFGIKGSVIGDLKATGLDVIPSARESMKSGVEELDKDENEAGQIEEGQFQDRNEQYQKEAPKATISDNMFSLVDNKRQTTTSMGFRSPKSTFGG